MKKPAVAFLLVVWLLVVAESGAAMASSADLAISSDRTRLEANERNDASKKQLCQFCHLMMPIVRNLVFKNKTAHLRDVATYLCYKRFKIANEDVCESAIREYEPSVISVVKQTSLTSNELCSVALDCAPIENPVFTWNITLSDVPKPPVKPYVAPKDDAAAIRILHLADIHIDFDYEPGANVNCDQPLCCRKDARFRSNLTTTTTTNSPLRRRRRRVDSPFKPAGYWGDYGPCDIPLWTVENMFDHLAKNEKFDMVYWTGDLPPHNIWNQTRQDQLSAIRTLTQLFKKYFPKTIVLPSLGNHEAQPCNLYPTQYANDDNIKWLYSTLAEEWTKTGLPVSLVANLSYGAFYSIEILPKLRLISLNTNYCPKENFWLFINSTDPLGQLQWLADTLQKSEDSGEKVHIIGHIDPSKCLKSWSRNYNSIVSRYESTITGQFFGHTHKDEIKIFYDTANSSRPVSVAYLAPSVTTESFLNPAYRVYTLDASGQNATMQLIDSETYVMSLEDANRLVGAPKWTKEYSARDAFGMDDLSPKTWSGVVDKMLDDVFGSLADKAIKYFSKSSDAFPKCNDYKCRRELICNFKKSTSENATCG